jgi:hypothetical protein
VVQGEMRCTRQRAACQHGLKLGSRLQALHARSTALYLARLSGSQTLAAFGAAGINHSATTSGLHANEKTMRACAANLGGLVSALHFEIILNREKTQHYRKFCK